MTVDDNSSAMGFGVRTRKEIDREKFALKALRGDFSKIPTEGDAETQATQALQVVML